MKLTDIYGEGTSSFLKAADIQQGTAPIVYIAEVNIKDTNFDNKPGKQLVLTFYFQDKKMGLNITQAKAIEGLYGMDFTQWVNCGIQIGRTTTTFQGQQRETILVFPVRQADLPAEHVQQGQAWLQQKKAEQAAAAQTPAFSGPSQFSGPPSAPPANAFAAPPAPVEQTGSQFNPNTGGSFGGNPFQS